MTVATNYDTTSHTPAASDARWDGARWIVLVPSRSQPGLMRRVADGHCDCPATRACWHLDAARSHLARLTISQLSARFNIRADGVWRWLAGLVAGATDYARHPDIACDYINALEAYGLTVATARELLTATREVL